MKDELLSDSIRSPSRLNYRDESSGAISNSGDTTFGRRWNNRDSSKKHNRRRNKVSSRSKSGYKWKPSFGFIHLRVFPSVLLLLVHLLGLLREKWSFLCSLIRLWSYCSSVATATIKESFLTKKILMPQYTLWILHIPFHSLLIVLKTCSYCCVSKVGYKIFLSSCRRLKLSSINSFIMHESKSMNGWYRKIFLSKYLIIFLIDM